MSPMNCTHYYHIMSTPQSIPQNIIKYIEFLLFLEKGALSEYSNTDICKAILELATLADDETLALPHILMKSMINAMYFVAIHTKNGRLNMPLFYFVCGVI